MKKPKSVKKTKKSKSLRKQQRSLAETHYGGIQIYEGKDPSVKLGDAMKAAT